MSRETLDQQRAKSAYQAVRLVAEYQPPKARDRYKTLAKDLPVMLLKMGIGQTLVFLASKRERDHGSPEALLIGQLTLWLHGRIGLAAAAGVPPDPPGDWLVTKIMDGSRDTWHAATHEAIAYSTWLKRFAEALLEQAAAAAPAGTVA